MLGGKRLSGPSSAYRTLATALSPRRVGRTVAIRVLADVLDRVAAGDAWVVLIGERGSGRGLAARRLHARSSRAEGPLVELDAGALADEVDPIGTVRAAAAAAAAGSLIVRRAVALDEASLAALRASDARVLLLLGPNDQSPSVQPAGMVTVRVPALRQRRSDIPLLIDALLAEHGRATPQIEPAALARLVAYDWPGNVAELDAVLGLLAIRRPRATITVDDLDRALLPDARAGLLAEVERRHVLSVLAACGGNRSLAARELGISPRTLYNQLRRYHADAPPEQSATTPPRDPTKAHGRERPGPGRRE